MLNNKARSPQSSLRITHITPQSSCAFCGAKDNLTVDHIVPKTWAKGFNPHASQNIQVLCVTCHVQKQKVEVKLVKQVMVQHFTVNEAIAHIQTWAPGTVTKRFFRMSPEKKWKWRKQRSIVLRTGNLTIGVMLFAKKRLDPGNTVFDK